MDKLRACMPRVLILEHVDSEGKCMWEQEKQQLTIFYGGKVLVFNDFPADKAPGLMQMVGKGNPVIQNVSAPVTVTEVQAAAPALDSNLPAAQVDAHKPAH